MKKRIWARFFSFVLLCAFFVQALPVSSAADVILYDGICGENLTWTLNTDGLLTISGTGEMEDYSLHGDVPWNGLVDKINCVVIRNGVTSISYGAFGDCTGLTSVTIPNSVTSIGYGAFYGCTGLTSITIPDSVTSIGDSAFHGCTGLTNVTIPDSMTSIDSYTFNGCTGLTNVTIPDSVTSIGGGAFYGCTGLTSVTIPDSVTNIGSYAFRGCTGLTSITIPDSVTSIDDYAFADCTGLASITVSSGNKNYDSRNNCNGIIETATNKLISGCKNTDIPDSVTSIGDNAFCGCTGLTSITIPDSVTSIGIFTFTDCTGLTSVTIPDSVTNIGDWAFWGCTGLVSITIPDSVTRIDHYAFADCTGLASITVSGGNKNYDSRNNCNGIIATASNTLISGCKNTDIPDSVTCIGGAAFRGCTGLTSITIPDSVTSIDYDAFRGCTGLTSITIPDSVTSINSFTFYGCTGLTSITIPDSVTRIGDSAFWGCTGLTSVTIPDSVTSIGDSAFRNCTGLTSITIPDSVTKIDGYAFADCTGLTSITVSDGNKKFDSRNNCNGIITTASNTLISGCKNTDIPDSVTSIGYGAFYGCTGLTSITIPDGVTSIGDGAFADCTGLASVCFMGDAPVVNWKTFQTYDEESYAFINIPGLTLYYIERKSGWTTPTWGEAEYPTAVWDGVNIPQPHTHSYTAVVTAPTCTEQGYTTHTCECGASYVDAYTDALGHDWGDPVYDWADDHSAITATRVCKRDPAHTETETGIVISAVTKEATYDAEGEITYTAAFANPAFEPQTAVVSLPRLERPTPTPAENPFADIHESAYYHDPVLWAVANNVTNGTSATTFSPDEGCTRAQVVTFLWRATGKPDPASSENPFSDVKEGAYYYNAVLWAVENGITNGTSDKTFSPDETCTRAQIVTFLWRYEEQPALTGTNNPFADVKPSAYFGSAVLWAVEKGITNGTSATTFDPEDTCTRAQVVTFLYRDIVKS